MKNAEISTTLNIKIHTFTQNLIDTNSPIQWHLYTGGNGDGDGDSDDDSDGDGDGDGDGNGDGDDNGNGNGETESVFMANAEV